MKIIEIIVYILACLMLFMFAGYAISKSVNFIEKTKPQPICVERILAAGDLCIKGKIVNEGGTFICRCTEVQK